MNTRQKPGPKPKLTADALRELIARHRGNVKAIAAGVGMSRNAVINAIRREHLGEVLETERRTWSPIASTRRPAAAYAVGRDIAWARKKLAKLGLERGDRTAVMHWLYFMRGLRALGVLPADMQIEPGVIMALKRGDVTAEQVTAAYGPAFLAEVLEAGDRT